MKEHIHPLTPVTVLSQHGPVEWNGGLINFTTKKIMQVNLITANVFEQTITLDLEISA